MSTNAVGRPMPKTARPQGQRPGWVYFIQCDQDGPIKIGWTGGNVDRRLSEIQTSVPVCLSIRRVVFGTHELEHYLHRLFAATRLRGEWFEADHRLTNLTLGRSYELAAGTPPDVRGEFFSLPEVFAVQKQMDLEPLGYRAPDRSGIDERAGLIKRVA